MGEYKIGKIIVRVIEIINRKFITYWNTRQSGDLNIDLSTFLISYHWIFLKIKELSDKTVMKIEFFVFYILHLKKSFCFWENVREDIVQKHKQNMTIYCPLNVLICIPDNWG